MKIINFIKIDIITLNIIVYIWAMINFNSYIHYVETNLQVPQSLYFNRLNFILGLNIYFSQISLFTILLNLKREIEYSFYYYLNFILSTMVGVFNYVSYIKCDNECRVLLETHKSNILMEYISLFQLFISLSYVALFFFVNKKDNTVEYTSLPSENLPQTRNRRMAHL